MRDAWCGQTHIRNVAEHRGYFKRRSNFSDGMAERYLRSGRYPNLVGKMVNQGVYRALCRDPQGMELLSKYVDNPEKFLSWFLKELATVGGAGIALNLVGTKPEIVQYNIENVVNWSECSIAVKDSFQTRDEFGFMSEPEERDIVLWLNKNGNAVNTTIDRNGERIDTVYEWSGKTVPFIPFCRVCTEDKPLFYGLGEASLDYFLLTALRNYVLHQMVPQPVITLPDENAVGEQQLKQFLEDKTIEYGAGNVIVLPHGARFEIVSPVVKPLSEMRQELVLIKDEMISQGVNSYMQRGGQIGNMNADTVRMHMNEQMMSFYDVLRQAEYAINKLLTQIVYLEEGDIEVLENGLDDDVKFKFKEIDFSQDEIEDMIDNVINMADKLEEEGEDEKAEELKESVIEELEQRKLLE